MIYRYIHTCVLLYMFLRCTLEVKVLNTEQRKIVEGLQAPSQLPAQERRMFYNALERRIQQGNLPAGLVTKYHSAAGSHSKKLPGRVITLNPKPLRLLNPKPLTLKP